MRETDRGDGLGNRLGDRPGDRQGDFKRFFEGVFENEDGEGTILDMVLHRRFL